MDRALLAKFPAILQKGFIDNSIDFPIGTKWEYEKILVYRVIERKKEDYREVTRDDFRSYAELKKNPKRMAVNLESDPKYYGVSSFIDRKKAENLFAIPNPYKKIAKGFVVDTIGPQYMESKHVCWWLYNHKDVTGFIIDEGKDE
jgi:hypothetical protein